jgi:hypothetical protein
MMKRFALLGLLIPAVVAPLAARSVQPPNIAGLWVMAEGTPDTGTTRPFFRQSLVTQDAQSITIASGQEAVTYRLDGQATEQRLRTVVGEEWILESKVVASDTSLTFSTTYHTNIGQWTDTVTCSLDGSNRLVVNAKLALKNTDVPGDRHWVYSRQPGH